MKQNKLKTIMELIKYGGNRKRYVMLIISVIFIAASNFIVSFMLQQCIDAAINRMFWELMLAGGILIVISIFCGIFYYLYGKERERLKQESAKKIKAEVFNKWMRSNFNQTKTIEEGKMITYITEDADKCAAFVSYTLFPLLQVILCLAIGSIYTLYYAWQIFLVVVCLAVFLVLILS